MNFKKTLNIILIFLILLISLCVVSAQDNTTQIISDDVISSESLENEFAIDYTENIGNNSQKIDTQIEVNKLDSYYKEKNVLVSYIKDANGTPIKNKEVNIFLDGKQHNKTSDDSGKITMALDLKPNTYNVTIKFEGDENFTSANADSTVKIKKTPLAIKMSNFNTYYGSGLFFNVKVYNKITGNPVEGIRVAFKVYSTKTKKYTNYYATTNSKGIATLNKNLKEGTYKISAKINDSKNKNYISYKDSKAQVTMKVTPYVGEDCCSFYLQVSDTEAVGGFRRDNTAATTITVKNCKINGFSAVKHSNANGFVHLIVFSNGWIVGNGGLDSSEFITSMQNLVTDMIKSNKIKMSSIKKIYRYKRSINFGHFAIKAPNGEYAVAWKNKIITGKLKPGEFLCTPNFKEYYRHSTYGKYSKNPAKAAIKVGATDRYGVNRRQVVVLHWKATADKNYKVTSSVKCYAANDNGRFVGVSSGRLIDTVKFKNNVVSGYRLPYVPNMKYMGSHNFGNIDKLVKTQTTVKAPGVTNKFNDTKYFKVTVKNKNTKKVISGVKIKIKVVSENGSRTFTVKTDKKGVAKIDTKILQVGNYSVVISPANSKYLISGKSKITIEGIYENTTDNDTFDNTTLDNSTVDNATVGNSTLDNSTADNSTVDNATVGNSTLDNSTVGNDILGSINEDSISNKDSKNKETVKVKATEGFGCCSFYLQVSDTESVAGFRRDATNPLNIYIKSVKWYGRTAIKQYKTANSYFFHSITTSDGWMIGTGGIDNPTINRAIEKLAGNMVKSNSIKKSVLKKIQYYEQVLGLGHFSIKAPDGRYAVVWKNGYIIDNLKPGEFFCCPNLQSYYRHDTYAKYGTDPVKAAVKVGATDAFGVNRRDITVFHWKSTTSKYFKTTSSVEVYASNDNGKLVGRSTASLKDNIYYKNKFISKNVLPVTPNAKFIGKHYFGNIDKLIKTPTTINAPEVTNKFNTTKYFKITVKNQKSKKVIKGLTVKVRISSQNMSKTVYLKTDSNGVIKIDTKSFNVGSYDVIIRPNNNKYLISADSKIVIKE